MNARVKEVVHDAGPSRKVTLIFSVDTRDQVALVASIEDLADRIRRLHDIYREAKQPVFDYLADHKDVKVVNGLEGTPQLILSASARAWRRLMDQQNSFLFAPNVDVSANEIDLIL